MINMEFRGTPLAAAPLERRVRRHLSRLREADFMKMMQQEGPFKPIAIVLETEEDALLFLDIIDQYVTVGVPESESAYHMAMLISNWFTNEAKL